MESELVSLSLRCASSSSKLDFPLARDNRFVSGPVVPKVTTNVSQLSGREPSRNSASTSSARGTYNDVSVGKHVPPDGTGCKMQRTGSSQNWPRSVPNRSEGQRCKYAEKSYMYKYDLGHRFHTVVGIVVVVLL